MIIHITVVTHVVFQMILSEIFKGQKCQKQREFKKLSELLDGLEVKRLLL